MAFEDLHRPLTSAGFKGAVKWLILISGAVLILQQFWGGYVVTWFGLISVQVLQHGWFWQPLTYIFLHGGIFHWLFNMFILWMFGRELEVRWGTPYFISFCVVAALGAAGTVLLITPHSNVPLVGSSGIIFGLLAAFALMYPDAVMYMYFVIPMKAWQAAALFGFIEFFASLQGGASAISSIAHLGGLLSGYLYLRFGGKLWRKAEAVSQSVTARFQQASFSSRGKQSKVVLHELTDDLALEVDRILDKILKQGVDALSSKEKEIMERYSKLKH